MCHYNCNLQAPLAFSSNYKTKLSSTASTGGKISSFSVSLKLFLILFYSNLNLDPRLLLPSYNHPSRRVSQWPLMIIVITYLHQNNTKAFEVKLEATCKIHFIDRYFLYIYFLVDTVYTVICNKISNR